MPAAHRRSRYPHSTGRHSHRARNQMDRNTRSTRHETLQSGRRQVSALTAETLLELQREGKILALGVSNYSPEQMDA
jgi:diketogulonate reductase-like aldo/keto reductase